jgi:hypothetical protein
MQIRSQYAQARRPLYAAGRQAGTDWSTHTRCASSTEGLDASCVAAAAKAAGGGKSPGEACTLPEDVAPHIQVPLFVMNSKYVSQQPLSVEPCSWRQLHYIQHSAHCVSEAARSRQRVTVGRLLSGCDSPTLLPACLAARRTQQ